jgi:hypothetical protein
MPKTKWTPDLTDFFITALVDECRAGNRPHKTLNPLGRQNVLKRLRDYTGEIGNGIPANLSGVS